MKPRVLLTGGTGFVGRQVLPLLLAAGHEVICAGRNRVLRRDVENIDIDLLDGSGVDRVLTGARATHLMHLAWYAEPGRFWTSDVNLDWVGASLRLLRGFAAAGGQRAVLAGSCAEYGWGSGQPLDELSSSIAPATLYGVSKDAVRRVACAHAEAAGVSLAWARLFYLYGPHEKSGRLVGDAIAALSSGKPLAATSGDQQRDFMHVEDVAAALVALLATDVRGAVNIGTGRALAVKDVLNIIAERTDGAAHLRLGAITRGVDDPDLIVASIRRLRDEVGFVHRYCFEDGLADTVRRWRLGPSSATSASPL